MHLSAQVALSKQNATIRGEHPKKEGQAQRQDSRPPHASAHMSVIPVVLALGPAISALFADVRRRRFLSRVLCFGQDSAAIGYTSNVFTLYIGPIGTVLVCCYYYSSPQPNSTLRWLRV